MSASKPLLFPDDVQFWYEIVRAFGASSYGGSDFGEITATASRIISGDYNSWYSEWNSTAERVATKAADQLARDHRISAHIASGSPKIPSSPSSFRGAFL